jgi:hypothetical protein
MKFSATLRLDIWRSPREIDIADEQVDETSESNDFHIIIPLTLIVVLYDPLCSPAAAASHFYA